MNPSFFTFLLLPFLLSLIFLIGTFAGILIHGPKWDITIGFIIFASLTTYLGFMMQKAASKKGSLIEYPGSEKVPTQTRIFQTNFVIISTFVYLLGLGLFIFNIKHVRNFPGLGFSVLGLVLWYSAISNLIRSRNFKFGDNKEALNNQLNSFERAFRVHAKFQAVFILSLIILALIASFYFVSTPASNYFSLFDLIGFLFFLTGYGLWFVLRRLSLKIKMEILKKVSNSPESDLQN